MIVEYTVARVSQEFIIWCPEIVRCRVALPLDVVFVAFVLPASDETIVNKSLDFKFFAFVSDLALRLCVVRPVRVGLDIG